MVCKPSTDLPDLDGAERWEEPSEAQHPMVGIAYALERAGGPVLVCACDMPFVTAELVAHIAAGPGTVVLEAGGRLHPLLARYDPAAIAVLNHALAAQRPLHEAIRDAGAVVVSEAELARFGDPARLLFNVNTPADLSRAEQLL